MSLLYSQQLQLEQEWALDKVRVPEPFYYMYVRYVYVHVYEYTNNNNYYYSFAPHFCVFFLCIVKLWTIVCILGNKDVGSMCPAFECSLAAAPWAETIHRFIWCIP